MRTGPSRAKITVNGGAVVFGLLAVVGTVTACGHTAKHMASHHHRYTVRSASRRSAASANRGGIDPTALSGLCDGPGPVVGDMGALRPGEAAAARKALGKLYRAQIADSASGTLFLFAPPGPGLRLETYFSRVGSLTAQSSLSALHSCDLLLSDQPKARPVIVAAEKAAVSAGLAPSLQSLSIAVQEILVGGNPVRQGSVVVTLLQPGAPRAPIYQGVPPTYPLTAISVIMSYPGLHVTGVGSGGF